MNTKYLSVTPEIQAALAEGRPVVALESTILSHGMPYPENLEFSHKVEEIIRAEGAIPATTAIIGGKLKVGLNSEELELMCRAENVGKVSRRDVAVYLSEGLTGATTVATTMMIAELAGIRVFATGGIGGVHRGAETTMDISADLQELAHTSVAVVCAGAKSLLDIPKTLEYLETMGVPVLGMGTEDFPAFYCRRSGCKVLYLTTRWEDAVKTSERIAVVLDDEIEKNFDAAYVRNNPWELVQMLESGTYRGGESSRDFLQAMESIVQSTSEIFGSGNRSLEELAEVMRRSLNCGGSYIYVQGQHKAIETPAGQATGLNYERLGELVSQKSGAVFYGTIRDGYFSDLFLERPKQIRTVLVLPVVCHNDLIGHCGVWFDSVYFYSQEDLLMLSALANEIALAMETSRLMSRSVLLQESHHRIKNNLQMIISLLYMQKEQLRGDKAVSDIVDATISRIKSISSVHDLLSASTHGSGLISLKEMTERILRTYQSMGIEFHVQIDDIYSAQRLSASVALVINELVSNCFKHAFAGMDAQAYKQVNVSINMQGEQVCLCVQDNGGRLFP